MAKLKCLGCEGDTNIYLILWLHDVRGAELKSRTIGVCEGCATPGSSTYEAFRQRLGTLVFMQKNVLVGMAKASAVPDSKTAAAGGDR